MTSQYPPIIVRTYPGHFEQTSVAYQLDANHMAQGGYFPIAQSYEPGNWTGALVLVSLLLCLIAIGFALLLYMLVIRPPGALVVTYQFRGPMA